MIPVDYSKFGPNGPGVNKNPNYKRWWLAPRSERAAAVCATVKFISEYDSKRQTQYQISNRLYGNSDLMGLNGLSYSKVQSVQGASKDRLTYNVCQSVVDTITSKIAKNKPKPMFLTSGGDYKLQRKAKKLDQFVEGVFYENKTSALSPIIFRDGCVAGDGFVHVFAKDGRIKYERVIASEIYVDWVDGFYNDPRQMHRVKNIDREVVLEWVRKNKGKPGFDPDAERYVMNANSASAELVGVVQNISDQITVFESWHIPSGLDADDGLHTINIAEGNIYENKYEKNFFPFAQFGWCKRMYGIWSQGLVEQIQNIQLEINKILWVIQRSFHLAGSFKVFLEAGSKIVTEKINNDIGAIVTYTGTMPQYVVPAIVATEMYSHLMNLKNSAYEQAGISQLSASAQKPAGLDSGRALREYNDIESDRFMTIGRAYEDFHLALSNLTIDTAKEIYDNDRKLQVRVPGMKFIDTIDWKDVNMKDDEYILKMFPVSSLPNEPAGRLQTIQEYIQAGFINPRTGRKLLDFPDLQQVEDLANAQEDYLNEILEKIVDDGEFTPPEPQDDLKLAKELALQYYSQGKCNGLEEEKLDLLRNFMDQIDVLTAKAAAAAMAPPPGQSPQNIGPAPGMGAPQAVPTAPPVSDMLPNAPGAS